MRAASFYSVGVAQAEAGKDSRFGALHARRRSFLHMIEAAQMQHPVDHEMGIVRRERLVLLPGLSRDNRVAEHDVSVQGPAPVAEAENVGRVVARPESPVQPPALGRAHYAQGHFERAGVSGASPRPKPRR
jgi:hypothetical protein